MMAARCVCIQLLLLYLTSTVRGCPKTTTIVEPCPNVLSAIARFNGSPVTGSLVFTQSDSKTTITGSLSGLSPGLHGFHIHMYGDTSNNCASASGHYNPNSLDHGGPTSKVRHVGDLGNINVGSNGQVVVNIVDNQVKLTGVTSVLGRAVVIHSGEDDLGLGGNAGSRTTGNAGSRVGCAIIAVKNPNVN